MNFYRNSVETSLFSLFLQGKFFLKNHLTEGISQAEFLKNFPDQAGISLHDLSSKAVNTNKHLMTNQKTVRREDENITLIKRTNFQDKRINLKNAK